MKKKIVGKIVSYESNSQVTLKQENSDHSFEESAVVSGKHTHTHTQNPPPPLKRSPKDSNLGSTRVTSQITVQSTILIWGKNLASSTFYILQYFIYSVP